MGAAFPEKPPHLCEGSCHYDVVRPRSTLRKHVYFAPMRESSLFITDIWETCFMGEDGWRSLIVSIRCKRCCSSALRGALMRDKVRCGEKGRLSTSKPRCASSRFNCCWSCRSLPDGFNTHPDDTRLSLCTKDIWKREANIEG